MSVLGPEWLVQRLQAWARACTVGDGSGFAAVNTLHPSWSPPPPGRTPSMKVASGSSADVRRTHAAIGGLSLNQANAVVAHYCWAGTQAEKAMRLEVAASTMADRVLAAHKELAQALAKVPGGFY